MKAVIGIPAADVRDLRGEGDRRADCVEKLDPRGALVWAFIAASVDLMWSPAPLGGVWRAFEGFGRLRRVGTRLLHRLVHEGGDGRAA